MARKGRVDRGLVQRKNAAGKPVWYVRLWHNRHERWFGSFPTKTKARIFYEERKLEQREAMLFPKQYQRRGQVSLAQVVEMYVSTTLKPPKGRLEDRRYAKFWTAQLPGAKLGAMTAPDILGVRQGLMDRGYANSSVNRALAFLRHVLKLAVRDRLLAQSPMDQVTFLKESPGRLRFLSLEEEVTLLEAIGPKYAPWVRLAILTGLRQGEQFTLRWRDVNLEQGVLTLSHTKAGQVQYLPLNQEAQAILRSFDYRRWTEWVFPSSNPSTPMDPANFYHRIYLPAVKAAGLEDVIWHTLRHTFASRLAMAGATESDIAACLRHSTTALVRRYAHLSPSHLKGVVEKVSGFGRRMEEGPSTGGEALPTMEAQQEGSTSKNENLSETEMKPGKAEWESNRGKTEAA